MRVEVRGLRVVRPMDYLLTPSVGEDRQAALEEVEVLISEHTIICPAILGFQDKGVCASS